MLYKQNHFSEKLLCSILHHLQGNNFIQLQASCQPHDASQTNTIYSPTWESIIKPLSNGLQVLKFTMTIACTKSLISCAVFLHQCVTGYQDS